MKQREKEFMQALGFILLGVALAVVTVACFKGWWVALKILAVAVATGLSVALMVIGVAGVSVTIFSDDKRFEETEK